jgi:cytochrome P450
MWERLAISAEQIPDAIAEGMRVCPGTPRQMRLVAESFELAGHQFEKDDIVSLNLNAAGRDPNAFDNPNEFRCGRNDPAYDIGFGFGRHNCLGQPLAKTEMAEAVAVLVSRLTNVEIAGPPRLKPTGVIAGFDSLPVRFAGRVV